MTGSVSDRRQAPPVGDVIVFVRARLNEDEAKARAAAERKAGFVAHWAEFDTEEGTFLGPFGAFLPPEYQTNECDTPEHTLRVIAAHREIVQAYEDHLTLMRSFSPGGATEETSFPYMSGMGSALSTVVHRLASVYADHANYDERWRLCY